MAGIRFLNMHEIIGGMNRRVDDIKKAQRKAALQMGIIAKQEMQAQVPPHIVTSHWQKSIHYWIEPVSDFKTILTIGSDGAERYYYIQEALNHPIEIGLHRARPAMTDAYQRVITGELMGRSVTQNVSISNVDEFGMMGGM